MRTLYIEVLANTMAPSRASAVREGGGEASVGVRAGGLLSLVKEIGVPTLSYEAEGNIVGGVFASRWRTPRGRRTSACAESPDAEPGGPTVTRLW